jgi:hypothetical protein
MEKTRQQRNVEINRLAQRMDAAFVVGHAVIPSPEFQEAQRGYMWEQHEREESEKFKPPYTSDHRFC